MTVATFTGTPEMRKVHIFFSLNRPCIPVSQRKLRRYYRELINYRGPPVRCTQRNAMFRWPKNDSAVRNHSQLSAT